MASTKKDRAKMRDKLMNLSVILFFITGLFAVSGSVGSIGFGLMMLCTLLVIRWSELDDMKEKECDP